MARNAQVRFGRMHISFMLVKVTAPSATIICDGQKRSGTMRLDTCQPHACCVHSIVCCHCCCCCAHGIASQHAEALL